VGVLPTKKTKMAQTKNEWVAQVSLLRPGCSGRSEKLSKGFGHRFRPTYAGANMGHPYGVVGTGDA
jgi:hypothetical protein